MVWFNRCWKCLHGTHFLVLVYLEGELNSGDIYDKFCQGENVDFPSLIEDYLQKRLMALIVLSSDLFNLFHLSVKKIKIF